MTGLFHVVSQILTARWSGKKRIDNKTMAARGLWTSVYSATKVVKACVAVKTLPIVPQVRGAKHFSRRRAFSRFKKENAPNVYSGFVGDVITNQNRALEERFIDEVPDYQEKIIRYEILF